MLKLKVMSILLTTLTAFPACTKVYVPNPTQPTVDERPNNTLPQPIPIRRDFVEIRVTGNATSARIRYSNPLDGLIQVTTVLPFFVAFESVKDTLFLSLEVTPVSYGLLTNSPFMSAQIFVNGNLFREAASSDFLLNTIIVSGTFRR